MNKKKMTALILASLLTINTMSMTAMADSADDPIELQTNVVNEGQQELNERVGIVLNKYFEWYYQNLKNDNSNINELNKIVGNNDLINFKKAKLEWMRNWYKNIDEGVKDYNIYIDINDIKLDGDYIYVKMTYGEDLINNRSEEVVQKLRNQEHKIILHNTEDNLMILNDYYQDELAEEFFDVKDSDFTNTNVEEDINKELQTAVINIKENLNNIDKISSEYKRNLKLANDISAIETIQQRIYSNYNGTKAKDYAAKYAESPNPSYKYYDNGGDCTNFVSQCIYAGGIPTDGTWYKDSNAWIRVTELRDWLVKKNYAKELDWQSNAKEGDLIQLYTNAAGWYHSLIITYKRTDGQLFISSHTADYYNRALSNYTATKRFLILTS